MAVKNIFFLALILFVNCSVAWCGASSLQNEEGAEGKQAQGVGVEPEEDPYKDVTWDSVLEDQKNQTTDLTVFHQKTKDADFYSISSTGSANSTETAVILPIDRRR